MADQVDKIIAFAKSKIGSHSYDNYCQRFVRECYQAGGIYGSADSATDAWNKWKVSTDKNIPICAAVYFKGTNQFGHVALYLGDGKIIHAYNGVKIDNLDRIPGYRGWGYQGGVAPSGSWSGSALPAAASEEPQLPATTISQKSEYDAGTESATISKFLSLDEPTAEIVERKIEALPELPQNKIRVLLRGDKPDFAEVTIEGDIQITYERAGTPGKLSCTIIPDENTKIKKGNRISVRLDEKILFVGYVFTISRDKNKTLDVTAYNQIRYLKNKDIYIYENKTASELIKMIADDYKIKTGPIADTRCALSKIEKNISLMDIIQNALDDTLMATGEVYVLYDKVGELCLENVKNMRIEMPLIDKDTAENYSYKTSIDSESYNKIKLFYENKETGSYDTYIAKDSDNIDNWGVLQYMDEIKNPDIGELKAQLLLKKYNRISRYLSISDAFGDTNVIAGSIIPVMLELDDISLSKYLMAEKVTHKISNRQHTMDLILVGGDFVV